MLLTRSMRVFLVFLQPPEKPARKHLGNGIGHGPGSRGEKLGTAGAGAGAGGGGGGGGGDKSTTGGAGSSKTSKKLNGANGSKENSSKQDNGNAATGGLTDNSIVSSCVLLVAAATVIG